MSVRRRLVVATLCATAQLVLCLIYGSQVRAEAARQRTEALERYGSEIVPLAVCTRALEAGEVVLASDVEEVDWLASLAPADAIASVDEAVGREVTVPAASGAPLTALNFREETEVADIPKGCVAVSVAGGDSSAVLEGARPGTHIAAYRLDDGKVRLVCKDATVLVAPGGAASTMSSPVSIAVPVADVTRVLAASAAGSLRLAVPADDVRGKIGVVAEREVAGEPAGRGTAVTSGEGGGVAAPQDAPRGPGTEVQEQDVDTSQDL